MTNLSRAERRQQVSKANNLEEVSSANLKIALNKIKTANGKEARITDNSRVSEQEVFSALIYEGLGKIDKNLQSEFLGSLSELIKNVKEFDPKNSVLRGTKRALKKLINSKSLVKDAARELRKFALGKSQLDNDNTRVSSSKLESQTNSTPVRSVKNALNMVSNNEIANNETHYAFKQNNKLEFLKKGKTDSVNGTSGEDTQANFDKEFKLRSENAKELAPLIEGPQEGYTKDSRVKAVQEFFEKEASSLDEKVHESANEILDDILTMGSSEFDQASFDNKLKAYMQDVFNIDISFKSQSVDSESIDTKAPVESIEPKNQLQERMKVAESITAYIQGEVDGVLNNDRIKIVKDFFLDEAKLNTNISSDKAKSIATLLEQGGLNEEAQKILDVNIAEYMKSVFNINIEF